MCVGGGGGGDNVAATITDILLTHQCSIFDIKCIIPEALLLTLP